MRILFSVFIFFVTLPVFAKDSLESVMARMRPAQAVCINYQETRFLGLLSESWKGTGRFYAVMPNVMLKEQDTPEKEVMGINGSRLFYYNSASDQKHQGQLDDEDPVSFQVSAFKGLMNGDLNYLKTRYTLEFKTAISGWQLTLTPRSNSDGEIGVKLIMRGLPEQVANKLELLLVDGDRTEYTLTPAAEGAAVKAKVAKMLTALEDQ